MSDTFLLGNHLERVKSTNEFYDSEVFYILFTTVKAFYQRQIPSVTTANKLFDQIQATLIDKQIKCASLKNAKLKCVKMQNFREIAKLTCRENFT